MLSSRGSIRSDPGVKQHALLFQAMFAVLPVAFAFFVIDVADRVLARNRAAEGRFEVSSISWTGPARPVRIPPCPSSGE